MSVTLGKYLVSHSEDMMEAKQLKNLQKLLKNGYDNIVKDYPEMKPYGGLLLLGPNYANPKSKILMLGINPGGKGDNLPEIWMENYKRINCLLGDPNDKDARKERYWRSARILFSGNLETIMENSTFSFCCPYRTSSWSNLPAKKKRILIQESKSIVSKIIDDCNPNYIIVAGVEGLGILLGNYFNNIEVVKHIKESNIYQWKEVNATWKTRPIKILQIPHLSRANSKGRLKVVSTWLEKILIKH